MINVPKCRPSKLDTGRSHDLIRNCTSQMLHFINGLLPFVQRSSVPHGQTFLICCRGGPVDHFKDFAAASRQSAAGRIFTYPLKAGPYPVKQDPQSRDACPAALLVGVDATPDPGCRAFTNFLGTVPQSLLNELEQRLQRLQSLYR